MVCGWSVVGFGMSGGLGRSGVVYGSLEWSVVGLRRSVVVCGGLPQSRVVCGWSVVGLWLVWGGLWWHRIVCGGLGLSVIGLWLVWGGLWWSVVV